MRHWFPKLSHLSLPAEIYTSSVDALYSDARSLYAGTVSAALASAVTAWKVDEPLFLLCSAALTLIGGLRGKDMRPMPARPRPEDVHGRAMGTALHHRLGRLCCVLSLWCFLTFALSTDPACI